MGFELAGAPKHNFQNLNDFLSRGFDSDRLLEQSQTISLPQAEVHSSEWYFNNIRMGYSDWHFKTPSELRWSYDIGVQLVTLQANVRGSVFMDVNRQCIEVMGNRQHNLFYSEGEPLAEGFLKPHGLHTSIFFLQFTKDAFLRLTSGANDMLDRFVENVMKGNSSFLSAGNLLLTHEMLALIDSIVNCRYSGNLKKMFLLSKSIEFLVLQAEASSRREMPVYKYLKTARDKECIVHAKEYVLKNLADPPSLSALACIVGINEYKLKRGFKEMFGTTVFGCISDARLDKAREQLLGKEKNASELAVELGYSSLQHFSYAFKKKFGKPPREFAS